MDRRGKLARASLLLGGIAIALVGMLPPQPAAAQYYPYYYGCPGGYGCAPAPDYAPLYGLLGLGLALGLGHHHHHKDYGYGGGFVRREGGGAVVPGGGFGGGFVRHERGGAVEHRAPAHLGAGFGGGAPAAHVGGGRAAVAHAGGEHRKH